MRHPRTDALESQIDKLLRAAADFEPDMEAPYDLVERAMQRATRQVAVVRIQRPIVALLWGSAAGAAAASAAAAFLLTSQSASNVQLPDGRESGAAISPYRVTAQQTDSPPTTPAFVRRVVRVRRTVPRARFAAEAPTARHAAWQSEDVEHALEQTLQPGLRFHLDEQGRPIDIQAGVFETLTVTENPSTCVAPETTNAGAVNGSAESSGESRPKEADLPSKED